MTEETEQQNQRPMTPDMQSFKITVTRVFEADFPSQEVTALLEQTGEDDPGEAISQMFLQEEKQNVAPQQKLLGVNVEADGPSDD